MNNAPPPATPESNKGGANILLTLHYLMQGRYAIAIVGSLVVGAAAAAFMWTSHKPVYTSHGWVQISPKQEVILEPVAGENIPMFEYWVRVQARLMTTPRLIDMAMRSPVWADRPAGTGPQDRAAFIENTVARVQDGQTITVSFSDENNITAQKGVEAVLRAYDSVYGETSSGRLNQRLKSLEAYRVQLVNDMTGIRSRKAQLAQQSGVDDFTPVITRKQELLIAYQTRMNDGNRTIDMYTLPEADRQQAATPHTPAQIANVDPKMARLLLEQEQYDREYNNIVTLYGERHRQAKPLRELLQLTEDRIAQRTEAFNNNELDLQLGGDVSTRTGAVNLAQVRAQVESDRKLIDETRLELERLLEQKRRLDEINQQLATAQHELDRTRASIANIQRESQASDRVELVNTGDVPSQPSNASDQFNFAALAGFGGASFVVGLCLLWGLADRRLRTYAAARNQLGEDAFIGVLPELNPDLAEPQQALAASHAIHEVRSLVHRGVPDGQPLVLGITSAVAGAGKTSTGLALGVSFAASGCRTLLIDFDAVGGGLTSRTARILRRHHARMLVDRGLLPAHRVEELVQHANQARISIAQAADRLDILPARQVSEVIGTSEGVGVFEALEGTPLYECVADTGIDNLAVLPIGTGNVSQVGTIPRHSIRELLKQARGAYDVVIVDSGPMLGSLEATIIASEVDEMIIIVSRGETVGLVRRAIDNALDAGARVAGLIYNKAQESDARRFSSSSVASRVSKPDSQLDAVAVTLLDRDDCPHEFGPLAYATAACLPSATRPASPRHQGAA
jgi:Mrp family chromosome partitioning ATPase